MRVAGNSVPNWIVLSALIALAIALRLLGAYHGALMYDESTHLTCALSIDLRPDHFNLVFRTVDHPLLSAYVVRASSVLFGDSVFGLRVLHVLVGSFMLVPVYLLGREVFSERAGLWAAALLAVDQFHLTWSYFFMPEILLLAVVSLVLLQFLRTTPEQPTRAFVLLGFLGGLSYLAKETAVVVGPVLWLAVLLDPARRPLLWSPKWYLAHAVALLVVLPDVLWNVLHFYEGYLYRDVTFLAPRARFSPRAVLLYLGEITPLWRGPDAFRPNYASFNPALIHWPAGLLYLAAVGFAVRQWRRPGVRLLLITFGFTFAFFTVLPVPRAHRNWWWASISVLPAALCAGELLDRVTRSRRVWAAAAALLLLYLGGRAVATALRPGVGVPRLTAAEFAEATLERARSVPEDERAAGESMLLHTLHVVGPHAELYAEAARAALAGGSREKAQYFARRSLDLDPTQPTALDVQAELAGDAAQ